MESAFGRARRTPSLRMRIEYAMARARKSRDPRRPGERPAEFSAGPAFLTIGLQVQDRPCVVVGGGQVATRRALRLIDYGAEVTIVSPAITKMLHALVVAGEADWICDIYDPETLRGMFLAVAATSDLQINAEVSRDGQEAGVLVCNTAARDVSDVIFPAVCSTAGVTVAVHTHGQDPERSRDVRDRIADFLRREPT